MAKKRRVRNIPTQVSKQKKVLDFRGFHGLGKHTKKYGPGLAGLSCALYAAQRNKAKSEQLEGQIAQVHRQHIRERDQIITNHLGSSPTDCNCSHHRSTDEIESNPELMAELTANVRQRHGEMHHLNQELNENRHNLHGECITTGLGGMGAVYLAIFLINIAKRIRSKLNTNGIERTNKRKKKQSKPKEEKPIKTPVTVAITPSKDEKPEEPKKAEMPKPKLKKKKKKKRAVKVPKRKPEEEPVNGNGVTLKQRISEIEFSERVCKEIKRASLDPEEVKLVIVRGLKLHHPTKRASGSQYFQAAYFRSNAETALKGNGKSPNQKVKDIEGFLYDHGIVYYKKAGDECICLNTLSGRMSSAVKSNTKTEVGEEIITSVNKWMNQFHGTI